MDPYTKRYTRSRLNSLEDLLNSVLSTIRPSRSERLKIGRIAARVLATALKAAKKSGLGVSVEVHGSYAKDTWLAGEADLDLFLMFDPSLSLERGLNEGLKLARKIARELGAETRECYAAHPYIEAVIEDLIIDIVPAFRVEKANQVRTPVDRTRLHTVYVLKRLKREQRDEVRLLKRFMKGVGVYGAEVRVMGFSGYLCELLVIAYGSFLGVLREAVRWKPYRTVVDIEGHYDRSRIPPKLSGPLIVVDPVDPERNAAAAVSEETLWRFIAAAKAFLKRPSSSFFFPRHSVPQLEDLVRAIEKRGTYIFALIFPRPNYPEDAVWGQLRKSERGLRKFFERIGIEVYGITSWLCGEHAVILVEVPNAELPPVELHKGPPVCSEHEDRFISKYLSGSDTVAGPFLREGRWYVLRRRRFTRVVDILVSRISEVGLAAAIRKAVSKDLRVLEGKEVIFACDDEKYRIFLWKWLARRENWL